jgi:hypothetical protein
MELRAARLGKPGGAQTESAAPPPAVAGAERKVEPEKGGQSYSVRVRYDTILYDTLQNMIRSAHAAQDFTYPSVADFIRAALQAYQAGMVLTELEQHGPKVETSLRLDRELWQFYKAWPARMRPTLLDRVLRTFVKHALGPGG